MNMKQFKYVLVLANEGSFSRAAEELNISQPSLSQYIKKIESQLGVELFVRANGNVRLTDAGKVYIDAGKKILDLENQMQQKFLDLLEHKIGSITIGTTPFRSVTMMPQVLTQFKKIYPDIQVIIDERETSELNECMEKGEFDLCVLTLPVDEKIFDYEIVMEEEVVLAVPYNNRLNEFFEKNVEIHEEQTRKIIDFKLLDGHAFVSLTPAQVMQKILNDLCRECEVVLKETAVVKSLEAQIEMVRSGIGLALVPTSVCKSEDRDKIQYYSIKQKLPHRKVVIAYRKGQYLSEVLKDLIDVMKLMFIKNNA